MTVSSIDEDRYFYYAPEVSNLLTATRRIRSELNSLDRQLSHSQSVNRLMKSVDDLEESLKVHFDGIGCFEREMIALASTRLTEKQIMIMQWMAENYMEEMVYTNLIERISDAMGMPRSTVRWSMKGLRDAGLISAGDKDSKGIPVRITGRGSIIMEYAVNDPG